MAHYVAVTHPTGELELLEIETPATYPKATAFGYIAHRDGVQYARDCEYRFTRYITRLEPGVTRDKYTTDARLLLADPK